MAPAVLPPAPRGTITADFTRSGLRNEEMRAMLSLYSLGTVFAAAALAQAPVMPELPKGPAKPGFDISRFALTAVGTFATFYVKDTYPLKGVLDEGKVATDTRLLVIDTAAGKLALITDQMTYHHIAQGRARNKDWMATF